MLRKYFTSSLPDFAKLGLVSCQSRLPVPCTGIKAPSKELAADRVLSESEIAAFWNELDLSPPIHTALKLELLLAQRIGEVLGMRWDELDLDKKLWTLTPDRTKNETVHLVPLPTQAVKLIEQMRILSGSSEYVFASPRPARSDATSGPLQHPIRGDSVSTALTRAIKEARIAHFSSHDLRRTAATNISALGHTDDLVGRILNHKNRTVTGRYNRYSYLDEKREALDAWAGQLDMFVSSNQQSAACKHGPAAPQGIVTVRSDSKAYRAMPGN